MVLYGKNFSLMFLIHLFSYESFYCTDKLRPGIFTHVTQKGKVVVCVFLEKTMRNFHLPRSLPTEAFTKFHERPNFLLKSEGSLLSRRLRRAVAKKQIHTALAKGTIKIEDLFLVHWASILWFHIREIEYN